MGCGGKFCRVVADTANQARGDFMDSGRWQEIQVRMLINFYFLEISWIQISEKRRIS
jgi:hypothetical protein